MVDNGMIQVLYGR